MIGITEEMRVHLQHMFDNWDDQDFLYVADMSWEDWTIDEVKEHLWDFAAMHDLDTLDSFLPRKGNKANTIPQLDGASDGLVDCDTREAPQTPTMTSPMSRRSDGAESVFDSRAPFYTTPSSQYTPAKPTEIGTPKEEENTEHTQRICKIDDLDDDMFDITELKIRGEPNPRIFISELSLKHRHVPKELLFAYNPQKNITHLRSIDPSTGALQVDFHTLVIAIEGVVYEGRQGLAAVGFHPQSIWNTVTWLDVKNTYQTKENAKLKALYTALQMISSTAAKDPSLKEVRIVCSGLDCGFAAAVDWDSVMLDEIDQKFELYGNWIEQIDEEQLSEVNELWKTITEGTNGERAVDVRLWPSEEEEIAWLAEKAMVHVYKEHGRDWYKETNNNLERAEGDDSEDAFDYFGELNFTASAKACLEARLEHHSFLAPQHVIDKGPRAVSTWTAQARAKLQQALLHTIVASDGCFDLKKQLRVNKKEGELVQGDDWLKSYEAATELMASQEQAQRYIEDFDKEQRDIWQRSQMQGQQMAEGSTGRDETGETGEGSFEDELVKQVLEMDWE
ncbi:hypothetical protein diail_8385 [Diaporthe ilicicola]|nr:hypothetical protein diail_8385 [Diaporthe ilicicola]